MDRDQVVKALDYIHEHPEEWAQGSWGVSVGAENADKMGGCGTAFCLAGTVAVLNGEQLKWEQKTMPVQVNDVVQNMVVWFANKTIQGAEISDVAATYLQLPTITEVDEWEDDNGEMVTEDFSYTDESLFSADNSLRTLYEAANVLLTDDGQEPVEIPDDVDEIETVSPPPRYWGPVEPTNSHELVADIF